MVVNVSCFIVIYSPIHITKFLLAGGIANSPFPSLHCYYKMSRTTTMQRESS